MNEKKVIRSISFDVIFEGQGIVNYNGSEKQGG